MVIFLVTFYMTDFLPEGKMELSGRLTASVITVEKMKVNDKCCHFRPGNYF